LAANVKRGHDVRSTVFIEARSMYRPNGPVELRPVCEVEFIHGLAAASATGLYGPCRAASAIVGHADLKLGDWVAPVQAALQAASPNRFRGIRHTVTWDSLPEIENREKEGVLATADYRTGAQASARKVDLDSYYNAIRPTRRGWSSSSSPLCFLSKHQRTQRKWVECTKIPCRPAPSGESERPMR
jgi:hypothetical protein